MCVRVCVFVCVSLIMCVGLQAQSVIGDRAAQAGDNLTPWRERVGGESEGGRGREGKMEKMGLDRREQDRRGRERSAW